MIRGLVALGVTAGLAGCQVLCVHDCYSPPVPVRAVTTVTVIPAAADNHIGTVVVDPDNSRTVLNTAYASARVEEGRPTVPFESSPEKIGRRFGKTLQARPLPPVSLIAYFVSGTNQLSEGSTGIVDELRAEIKRRQNSEITVIGHTDRAGSTQDNDALAERRAQGVRDLLVSLGIPAELITVASRGEREPIEPTADGVANERNRRVEISIR